MSCHSATANQVRLVLHTAAFWLMHGVRAAIPKTNPLATCEFATLRERLIKIGARVIEHIARIRVQLPTSCSEGTIRYGDVMPALTLRSETHKIRAAPMPGPAAATTAPPNIRIIRGLENASLSSPWHRHSAIRSHFLMAMA
jgi:Transposase DDE domain group 1